MVKLARSRARDDGGLAVPSDGIRGDLLVCGVDVERCDVAEAACDISERIGITKLIGQLCGALEADWSPASCPPARSAINGATPTPPKFAAMRAGDGRNNDLWERCMRAGGGRNLNGMLEIARAANECFKEPLMDTEVVKIATSAWQHDAAGLNFFTRPRIMLAVRMRSS